MKKYFIITVDTEGDNLWDWKEGLDITTQNAQFIPRFQSLCEKYGFKPCYFTNYEMALNKKWTDFGRKKAQDGLCEIGMHIHAWNSPPEYHLENRYGGNSYITEYPYEVIDEKIAFITKLLSEQFDCKITSARSGRWATNDDYFSALYQHGYTADCSVTPKLDLSAIPGCSKNCGNDYSKTKINPYYVINGLLEIPMTTRKYRRLAKGSIRHKLSALIKGEQIWLRPYDKDLEKLLYTSQRVLKEGSLYLEFMVHSSELMPGGSPYFKTDDDVEELYYILNNYFSYIADNDFISVTPQEFSKEYKKL